MVNENSTKLLFIGTGSAKTNLKRFYSSFIISNPQTTLLVDCGDGISKELIKQNINYDSIDSIIITHLHPDHFTGLFSLLVQMKLSRRENKLSIIIHKNLLNFLENCLEQLYLFKERLPFQLEIINYDFNCEIKLSEGFSFIAKANSHLEKYSQIKTSNKIAFISSSFIFSIGKDIIYYSADIGRKEDLYLFDVEYNYSIIETTHIDVADIFEFVKNSNSKKIFFIHIDEEKEETLRRTFSEEIKKGKILIPNDGDEYFL